MGCADSKLEERLSNSGLDLTGVVRKEMGTASLKHHRNSRGFSINAGPGLLVLTNSQLWYAAAAKDKDFNIPLDRLISVSFSTYGNPFTSFLTSGLIFHNRYKTENGRNSQKKTLVLEFNDMDTGMQDTLAIDCKENKQWEVAIRKARDDFRKNATAD